VYTKVEGGKMPIKCTFQVGRERIEKELTAHRGFQTLPKNAQNSHGASEEAGGAEAPLRCVWEFLKSEVYSDSTQ